MQRARKVYTENRAYQELNKLQVALITRTPLAWNDYRVTGPDCAVMCNLINTHKQTVVASGLRFS